MQPKKLGIVMREFMRQYGHVRWFVLLLLFGETILNYTDLQTLSVLAPTITRELNIQPDGYARIIMAMEAGLLLMFGLGGMILDKIGVRWGMVLAIGWWSAAQILHGYAQSEIQLIICRFIFGLGYPGAYLAAAKVVAEWFPPEERGIATGAYTAGATVGATISPVLVAHMAQHSGWRNVFVDLGLAGFGFIGLWAMFYRAPEKHSWLGPKERKIILRGRIPITHAGRQCLGSILRNRNFWAIGLGRLIGENPWLLYVAWLPLLLDKQFGVSLEQYGKIGWIPYLCSDVGCLGLGWLSGWLIRRNRNLAPARARVHVMTMAATITLLTVSLIYIKSLGLALAVLSLMMFMTAGSMSNAGTLPTDLFPQSVVGRVSGLAACMSVLGMTAFSYAVGQFFKRDALGELFVIMALMPVAAVILMQWMLKPEGKP